MNAAETLTELLVHWREGYEVHARILPLVYADLRRIAGGLSAKERTDHTLQATVLVNEAYIRLVAGGPFESRGHFFGAAANAMRHALVDYARRRAAVKRGGELVRVELEESIAAPSVECQQILDMDDALSCLQAIEPRQAELVKLRYFAGLSVREAAEALSISVSTAKDDWAKAKEWLEKRLGP
jgi:RNA polymerase sigma factor (TIGR02999 family)